MPSERLCDPLELQDAPVLFDTAAVQERIPQRDAMALLHAIVHHDLENGLHVGWHDSSEEDFWVEGHLPGRPLMPGICMVETAAQLCAFASSFRVDMAEDEFFGFGGVDKARFRGMVTPGQRLVMCAQNIKQKRRYAVYRTQGFVDGDMVFEGEILGIAM